MKQFIKDPYLLMRQLKEQRMPFELSKSLHVMDIHCPYGDFQWISPESVVPRDEVYFIRKVKRAASVIDVSMLDNYDTHDIRYFKMLNFIGEKQNCIELDIKGAYWKFSRWWMDDELYNSGFKVDKLTRLASLGNLAKVVTKSRFDGVNYHEDVEIIQETTKNLFFKAAYDVGELMSLIFQVCNNVLFFWVDAVFLSDDSELLIISNILATYGLEFSVYRCEKIIGTDKTIEVHSSEHKKKERTFMKEVYTSDYFVGRFKDYLFETKIKRT